MWREKIKSILSWQKGREAKGRAEKKEFPELRGKQDKKELFQKAILQESDTESRVWLVSFIYFQRGANRGTALHRL